jgi:hypothetical protein
MGEHEEDMRCIIGFAAADAQLARDRSARRQIRP